MPGCGGGAPFPFRIEDGLAFFIFSVPLKVLASAPKGIGSAQVYERRALLKIKGMMAVHQLTEWQFARIEYLLQEQHTVIDLFAKHGLLSAGELRDKIDTIQKVTRFGVDDVLTREQLNIWEAWDLKLDAVEARKHRVRHRLLPAP